MRARSILLLIGAWLAAMPLAAGAAEAERAVLQTCLEAAADFSPVYPTRTFPPGTREIIAVWQLAGDQKFQELSGAFSTVDVGAAAPPGFRIAEAPMQLGASRAGRFRFELPRAMPPGRYRLDVTADGQPWQSAEFAVAAGPPPPAPQRPEELVPLAANRVSVYDFTQEAGEGAHVELPDITPGPDGRLHARASYTVAATEPAGTRIDMRRNDRLVLEEWWRLGPSGLAVTQRKAGDETLVLEPPQTILAWPPGLKAWEWTAQDQSVRQSYKMWGPLPVDTPGGKRDGYVVFMRSEQPNGPALTIERQFARGLGLVRERTVMQLGPVTAMRQDLVLRQMGQ
jgi:hypothetical protein